MDSVASGMRCAELADQRHGHGLGHAGRQADGHPAGQRPAHAAQFFARTLHLVQDAAAMVQQQLAGLGGYGAAAVAHQQVLPQFHFQQPHLAAERGLRDVQRDGGTGEAAELGDPDEVFELPQIHTEKFRHSDEPDYAELF